MTTRSHSALFGIKYGGLGQEVPNKVLHIVNVLENSVR